MSLFNQDRVRRTKEAIKDCRDAVLSMHNDSGSIGKRIAELKAQDASCRACAFKKRIKLMDFCKKGKIIKPIKLYNICVSFKGREEND